MSESDDKAGQAYWDKNWTLIAPELLDVGDRRLANEVNLRLHELLTRCVAEGARPATARLLEVGCARSVWLPYFAREHGLRVSGLDYSPEGCRQAEAVLAQAGVPSDIHCADMFDPPQSLCGTFDFVFTLGVVEHFTDTQRAIAALRRFLRPGGTLITVIPNMRGSTGALQRLLDAEVYRTHVPLRPEDLGRAHASAGFEVHAASYFMATNFYVVNTVQRKGLLARPLARLIGGLAGRFSMALWQWERWFGRLPAGRMLSPYIACVARLP